MIEQKIADIIHEAFTPNEPCKIWSKEKPCPIPFEGCEPCILNHILALIASEQLAKCDLCEQLDKGLDEVLTDAVKRYKKQNKAMVEALQQILYEVRVNHVNPEYMISQIAKRAIDAALKGVE